MRTNVPARDQLCLSGKGCQVNLVSAFTSVRKQGGELKLLILTNKVQDLMQVTRLYTVFDIMDDEAAAAKFFAPITNRRKGGIQITSV
jgi:hypothetical protein